MDDLLERVLDAAEPSHPDFMGMEHIDFMREIGDEIGRLRDTLAEVKHSVNYALGETDG